MRRISPAHAALDRGRLALGLDADVHAMDALEHRGLLAQHALQPVALELGRPQPEDERAQLRQRLAREVADALELRARLLGAAVKQRGRPPRRRG